MALGGVRARPVGARQMRLYFHRLGNRTSSFLGPARTVAQLREELRATSQNVGNLVHLEAPAKLLRYDKSRGENVQFRTHNAEQSFKDIDRSFDGIVLGYANIIRNYAHLDNEARDQMLAPLVLEADWLSQTKCRIFALGIGLQDELAPRPDAIDPRLFRLLRVLNDRAEIFGVRGEATEKWLHAVGLTNAAALGCPSLFVYPTNALSIQAPEINTDIRVASAGRIQRNSDRGRLLSINRIGESFRTSYVFQTDFFALFRRNEQDAIYNDATGEVSPEMVRNAARKSLGVELSFSDYFLFRSVDKWRGFAASKDVYFGDRFHGGVVFIQCGRPAVMIHNDLRVQELVEFYGIPAVSAKDILHEDPVDLLRSKLSEQNLKHFHHTYLDRYQRFYKTLRAADLEVFNGAEAAGLMPPAASG